MGPSSHGAASAGATARAQANITAALTTGERTLRHTLIVLLNGYFTLLLYY